MPDTTATQHAMSFDDGWELETTNVDEGWPDADTAVAAPPPVRTRHPEPAPLPAAPRRLARGTIAPVEREHPVPHSRVEELLGSDSRMLPFLESMRAAAVVIERSYFAPGGGLSHLVAPARAEDDEFSLLPGSSELWAKLLK